MFDNHDGIELNDDAAFTADGNSTRSRTRREQPNLLLTAKRMWLDALKKLPEGTRRTVEEALAEVDKEFALGKIPIRTQNIVAQIYQAVVPITMMAGEVENAKTNQKNTRSDLEALITEKDEKHEIDKKLMLIEFSKK